MSAFTNIKKAFGANWTTVLIGWNGIGKLSPWPNRWKDFPPMITPADIYAYAEERYSSSSNSKEQDCILAMTSVNLDQSSREEVDRLLIPLSEIDCGDASVELRKWRLILLEDLMKDMPKDPLYDLLSLSEFWQNFGFPPDSPHVVQGKGNVVKPSDYYQAANHLHVIAQHRAWIKDEINALKKHNECNISTQQKEH